MTRVISFLLLSLGLVLPICAVTAWWFAQRALPVMDGVVTLPELARSVEVKFDDRGIAYIQAGSDRDAYIAQGYVTASERMFQMDIERRSALGELSEVCGPAFLAHDKLMRTVGFNRMAANDLKQLKGEVRSEIDAYTGGVNAYIEAASNRLPLEFILLGFAPARWTAQDTLAILKYRQYELDESWRLDDLRQRVVDRAGPSFAGRLFNETFHQSQVTSGSNPESSGLSPELDGLTKIAMSRLKEGNGFNPPGPTWGSNAWLVSPAMSDTKGALLACDTHSSLTSPDRFCLCSINTPDMHVAGAAIPGVPGILIGRNTQICWASTAARADVQDLVLEQFSPQFPGKYRTPQGWKNVTEIVEDIPVRFGGSVVEKVLVTRHGPILTKNDTNGIALAWTGADEKTPVIETFRRINHARNWEEFSAALENYSGASQTFLFADRRGNLAFHVSGNIPVRNGTAGTGGLIVPGYSGAGDWVSRVKFADLPHGLNPHQGYIVSDHPDFAGRQSFINPYRALRIGAVLASCKNGAEHVGLPEMAVLQGDEFAPLSTLVKKELRQAINRRELIDRYELSAMDLINKWDGYAKPDSPAASIYESFLATLARRVIEPKLGPVLTSEYLKRWPQSSIFLERILTEKPKEWLPPEERTYRTFFLTTFAQSLKNLRVASRSDDPHAWAWKNFHQVKFAHLPVDEIPLLPPMLGWLFDAGPVGVGGDQDTVNALSVVSTERPFDFLCDTGPVQRVLIDMSDDDKFYQTLTLGESGHLISPYRTDELKAWLSVEPHAVAFSTGQLDRQLQHKLLLSNQQQ